MRLGQRAWSQTVSKPNFSTTRAVKWSALPLGTSRRNHAGSRARPVDGETTGNSVKDEDWFTLSDLVTQIGMACLEVTLFRPKYMGKLLDQRHPNRRHFNTLTAFSHQGTLRRQIIHEHRGPYKRE